MASIASLSLTKGTNLFTGDMIDDPAKLTDQLVLFDEGYEEIPARHLRVNWNVKLQTSRTNHNAAMEALRPSVNALINETQFTMSSGATERFKVLKVRLVSSPDVTERLSSGRYLAEAIVQLDVININPNNILLSCWFTNLIF